MMKIIIRRLLPLLLGKPLHPNARFNTLNIACYLNDKFQAKHLFSVVCLFAFVTTLRAQQLDDPAGGRTEDSDQEDARDIQLASSPVSQKAIVRPDHGAGQDGNNEDGMLTSLLFSTSTSLKISSVPDG